MNRPGWSIIAAFVTCAALSASARAQNVDQLAEAVKLFPQVPSVPRSVSAVAKRIGNVTTPSGDSEQGDVAGEPLRQRIAGLMSRPTGLDFSTMPTGGGTISPAAAQAMAQLSQTAVQMTGDLNEAQQAYNAEAVERLRQRFEDEVDSITQHYEPAIERCLTQAERAGGSSCTDPTPQRDAAIKAAADSLLRGSATQFETYKAKLQAAAARGEAAIASATKAFGKSAPPMATSQIVMIRQNELNALLSALEGESDIVNYVAGHAAMPHEGGEQ